MVFIRSLYDHFKIFYALSKIPIYACGRSFSSARNKINCHVQLRLKWYKIEKKFYLKQAHHVHIAQHFIIKRSMDDTDSQRKRNPRKLNRTFVCVLILENIKKLFKINIPEKIPDNLTELLLVFWIEKKNSNRETLLTSPCKKVVAPSGLTGRGSQASAELASPSNTSLDIIYFLLI